MKVQILFLLIILTSFDLQTSAQTNAIRQTDNKAEQAKSNDKSESDFESAVLTEINEARQNPQKFAAYMETFRKFYKGNELHLPKQSVSITNEGLTAFDEAVDFLKNAKVVEKVELNKTVSFAANDHLKDLQKNDIRGHKGSDGNFPETRVEKYGVWSEPVYEIISYHSGSPREIVMQFLIDDGNKSRGHRTKLFDAKDKLVGLKCGETNSYGKTCVIVLTGGFTEKTSKTAENQPQMNADRRR